MTDHRSWDWSHRIPQLVDKLEALEKRMSGLEAHLKATIGRTLDHENHIRDLEMHVGTTIHRVEALERQQEPVLAKTLCSHCGDPFVDYQAWWSDGKGGKLCAACIQGHV